MNNHQQKRGCNCGMRRKSATSSRKVNEKKDDLRQVINIGPYVMFSSSNAGMDIRQDGNYPLPLSLMSMKSGTVFSATRDGRVQILKDGNYDIMVSGMLTRTLLGTQNNVPGVKAYISVTSLSPDGSTDEVIRYYMAFNDVYQEFVAESATPLSNGAVVSAKIVVSNIGNFPIHIDQAQLCVNVV